MIRDAFLRHPVTTGAVIGTIPGLAIAYYLYTHAGWYQHMIDWEFAHLWIFVPSIAIGIALAVITDDD